MSKIKFPLFILLISLVSSFSIVHAQQKQLNLSPNAKTAITKLANELLLNGPNPRITALKPQLDAQDYATTKTIGLLPDNPWYFLKNLGRGVRLFFMFDQAGKTYQQLRDGNEKTLEALLVTEKAANEKNSAKQDQLVAVAAQTLDGVGSDFDSVAKTLDSVKKTDGAMAYLLQQEAFQFAGYYLKHQILLQKQQDRLSEKDFLTIESARVKHLGSIAHIVALESKNPVIFGQQLSQLLTPEVGTNNTQLATIAVLRDLENNATNSEIPKLQNAQTMLQKELEIKFAGLPKAERLKQIERYITFVHGNPIREFQAYNFLAKSFFSQEMNILTQALKDAAAGDFKKHLTGLNTLVLQKQFVATVFSNYPIDMRLLFYTEIQLTNDKAAEQLKNLEAIKTLLGVQICSVYGKDASALTKSRFYTEATTAPSLLDLRIGTFLTQSLQNCDGKSSETVVAVADLQTKINTIFTAQTKTKSFKSLLSQSKAEAILKEEGITVASQDEQRVAEEIIEETQQIEEEISENPTVFEKEVQQIVETITTPTQETVNTESETIIEEIIQESEPTNEEIMAKEEQIIEEIVDAAETGETSPLVEELPQPVQEEISQETGVTIPTATPIPTPTPMLAPVVTTAPTLIPTVASTTTIIDTVAPVITSAPTTSEPVPTPASVEVAPGL